MKKILSLLLALCMMLSLVPFSAAAAYSDDVRTREVSVNDITASQNDNSTTDLPPTSVGKSEVQQSYRPGAVDGILNKDSGDDASAGSVTVRQIENDGADLKASDESVSALDKSLNTPSSDEIVRIIVVMEDKALLDQGYTTDQIATQDARAVSASQAMLRTQQAMLNTIDRAVEALPAAEVGEDASVELRYNYQIALNGMAIEAPYGALETIRAQKGVRTAFVAPQFDIPETGKEEITPYMYATKETFGSEKTWDTLGYTGAGMRIAIIDTGLDYDHPSFTADPQLTDTSLTKEEINSVLKTTNAYAMYRSHGLVELTADRVYRSAKVPFGFNYIDESLDITHDNDTAGEHGTHVAGIAAANHLDSTPVVGVAPDAQLIVMKVFGAAGGAYMDDVVAAIEDCYRLNVDAANLSLGSPAGFTDENSTYTEILHEILDHDMVVAIAAGNSGSAASGNGLGTNLNLSSDPDNGITSSPASWIGATMVASINNVSVMQRYIEVGSEKLTYTDSAATAFTTLAGKELTYVMVPGVGEESDYANIDVNGKVAVISRGVTNFTDKQTIAADHGAIACVIYDNAPGDLINIADAGKVPNIFVSQASGKILADNAVNGEGKLRVPGADEITAVPSAVGGQMSSFSSWGVSPDLQLQPDVAAPGGNIYSTINNGKYATYSGTSMATPHIAGMSALLLQAMREKYDLPESKAHTVAEALIMSTAVPVLDENGIPYSPRWQGAGSANVYSAIVSPVYLTADNGEEQTPKVSLGDDDSKTGIYTFSFKLNNLTDKAQTYDLSAELLTDQVVSDDAGNKYMSETERRLTGDVTFTVGGQPIENDYDVNGDGVFDLRDVQYLLDGVNGVETLPANAAARWDLNSDGVLDTADVQLLYELVKQDAATGVTVPAGGSVEVEVAVVLSAEDKAYMDANYPNGIYVDGFVRCFPHNTDEAVALSLPFMGFYGDWSAARVFDGTWYYDEDLDTYNRYWNVIFTNFGTGNAYLGTNPYISGAKYDPSNNVLSPDGDGYNDYIDEMYLALMRSAKKITFTWENAETGTVYDVKTADYIRKSYYNSTYGINIPLIVTTETGKFYDLKDESGAYLPDGTKLNLRIDAYLDDGDDKADETVSIPVMVDTEAPVLYTDEVSYLYNEYADTRRIEFFVSDNYKIAAVCTMTMADQVIDRMEVESQPGEKKLISLDVSDYDSTFKLAVCDYGGHETIYEVSFGGKTNYSYDKFYGYRQFSVVPLSSGYLYATSELNGWYSFETADDMVQHTSIYNETAIHAAEFIDGYVIGVDADSNIVAMKMGDWTHRTILGTLEINGTKYQALDMAFDYTTDTLYCLTDELMANDGGWLVKIDYVTGEVTPVNKVTGLSQNSYGDNSQALTLAIDNEGVMYTVDYFSYDLCTINKETGEVTVIGNTGYAPQFRQSMTVDHGTDELYWAAYQGYMYDSNFYRVDKATGQLTHLADTEYNGDMAALFKPYDSGKSHLPTDAAITGLQLNETDLHLAKGNTVALTARILPYYAPEAEITWSTTNVAAATVDENGTVTAVGEGEADIIASCGGVTAQCHITVTTYAGEMVYFDNFNYRWMKADVSDISNASPFVNGLPTQTGFYGGTYAHGNYYAVDATGLVYKMDAGTMTGYSIGSGPQIIALAYSYKDNFYYGIELVYHQESSEYFLIRLNPSTGEIKRIAQLDDSTFGAPMSALAIDYDGYLYYNGNVLTNFGMDAENRLSRFRIDANDQVVDLTYGILPDFASYSMYGSMAWSEENGGLFTVDNTGAFFFIDPSDLSNLSVVRVGTMAGTNEGGQCFNMGLSMIPQDEPAMPKVEATDFDLKASYSLIEGSTISMNLEVTPWNATVLPHFTVEDGSVISIDESGVVSGLKAGESLVAVYAEGLDQTKVTTVKVRKSAGTLYAFMSYDFNNTSDMWFSFSDTDTANSLAGIKFADGLGVGFWYDGYLYGTMQRESDGFTDYLVRLDLNDFSAERIAANEHNYVGMAMDYNTGIVYALAHGGMDYGALYQIDLATGAQIKVGESGVEMATMTVDRDGRIWAIGMDANLYEINRNTAVARLVGPTGAEPSNYGQAMGCDWNTGNIYWNQINSNTVNSFRLVDTDTGATTSLGVIGLTGAQIRTLFTVPQSLPVAPAALEPTAVALNEKMTVAVGKSTQLTGHVLPVSATSFVDQSLNWTSSDPTVATVDENGVVTGLTVGQTTITATAANGVKAECSFRVTETDRKFYGYDETNHSWISFYANNVQNPTVERVDAPSEATIAAAAAIGDNQVVAYDVNGRYYSIDPTTFERTLLSDGLYGWTHKVVIENYGGMGFDYEYEMTFDIVDLSYDSMANRLYLALHLENADEWTEKGMIVEVDPATGEIIDYVMESWGQLPANLLVYRGRAYFVDGYTTGILTTVNLRGDYAVGVPYQYDLTENYWSSYKLARGIVYDEYTDTCYAIRNNIGYMSDATQSNFMTFDLNKAKPSVFGEIGAGIKVTSLFIL